MTTSNYAGGHNGVELPDNGTAADGSDTPHGGSF